MRDAIFLIYISIYTNLGINLIVLIRGIQYTKLQINIYVNKKCSFFASILSSLRSAYFYILETCQCPDRPGCSVLATAWWCGGGHHAPATTLQPGRRWRGVRGVAAACWRRRGVGGVAAARYSFSSSSNFSCLMSMNFSKSCK